MKLPRRSFLTGSIAAATLPSSGKAFQASSSPSGEIVTPEAFGAKGDGVTNDSDALARLAAYVSARGGGEVAFRRTTYVVGKQARAPGENPDYAFDPAKLMEFVGCSQALIIRGNGAKIKCARGLRFGSFNRHTGLPTRHALPYYGAGEIATPYRWMIKIENCTGPVEVDDIELDGNLRNLIIGGPWGDKGRQIPAYGLGLYNNGGGEVVRDVYSHHHALDGILIDGLSQGSSTGAGGLFEDVRCEYNGRQGCSIVGGRGYSFTRCRFNHTGKAGLASAPAAGVDIEAEGQKTNRDTTFTECEFSNNHGAGFVADQGNNEGARFIRCTFIGTTEWSAWPNMAYCRFQSCTFVGPITNCFGDSRDAERSTQFFDCIFRDDPALTPTGQVYGHNSERPIAVLPYSSNVRFSRCQFKLTHDSALPWATNVVIFADCVMEQRSSQVAYPRGTFVGRNRISGKVDLYSAKVKGELNVNGIAHSSS